jgi:hypothetical protein
MPNTSCSFLHIYDVYEEKKVVTCGSYNDIFQTEGLTRIIEPIDRNNAYYERLTYERCGELRVRGKDPRHLVLPDSSQRRYILKEQRFYVYAGIVRVPVQSVEHYMAHLAHSAEPI